jgi:small basic protein
MRLQILSTEHWSLLASRTLAWNETFSRAAMFLSTLTGAIVALALVAQATEFGEDFRLFALVILPVVLFVGIGTLLRMGMAQYHDLVCVVGMNRIRAAYLELAPDVERFLVMGFHDDWRGIDVTMAVEPGHSLPIRMIASGPMLVSVINAVLLAAIASLLTVQLGVSGLAVLSAGVIAFVIGVAVQLWYARRAIARGVANYTPMFPGPTG